MELRATAAVRRAAARIPEARVVGDCCGEWGEIRWR
jgi:hypothetical protein